MSVGTNRIASGFGGGEESVWIVWRGWWNDSDCVSGLYNEVGLLRD